MSEAMDEPADIENNSECVGPNCDYPTPWDMSSIIVSNIWFCSPNCVRNMIVQDHPQFDEAFERGRVHLHEPQERPATINLGTAFEDEEHLQYIIEEFDDIHGSPWRAD